MEGLEEATIAQYFRNSTWCGPDHQEYLPRPLTVVGQAARETLSAT
jgi:hypothetical protein